MKRLICWLFLSAFALAQGSQQNIAGAPLAFSGVPSGACSVTQTALNTSNGDWYDCPSGSWVKANATGGAVAFSALTTGSNTTAAMTVGSGATLNVATGAVIDFSAIGAGTFKLPQAAAATASATITEILDTTNNNFHFWSNGADSINVVEASALAQNTIPKSTDATHGLLTASAITDNGTTVTSSEGIALSGASGAATTISTTTTNANLIISPNGTGAVVLNIGGATNPAIQPAGAASNTGLSLAAASLCWDTTGSLNGCISGTGIQIGGNKSVTWGSTAGATSSAAFDLQPLFVAAATTNVATLDTTASGNELGILRSGNACKVAADITLTVNTAINICQWSLPAAAKVWAWQCQIPWAISAGSGTNTLSIGVNASQTPAATTNASAEIKTTNTNTATEATVALSASGAVNVLTSGTITPAATLLLSSTSGTLSAPATAGTFTITMTAAGTTATAAAKAGTTCWFY